MTLPTPAADRAAPTIIPNKEPPFSDAASIHTDQPCRLLDLPAELRLDIYELVTSNYTPMRASGKPTQLEPCIMHTCHQIRSEVLPILVKSLQASIVHKEAQMQELNAIAQHVANLVSTESGGWSLEDWGPFMEVIVREREPRRVHVAALKIKIVQLEAEAGNTADLQEARMGSD